MATRPTPASASPLRDAPVRDLRAGVVGEVLLPGAPGYDSARRVFNAMVDRRPAVIARLANAEDVRRAVLFAREHGLPLVVKGGGHNVAGTAVGDGGLMLDLSAMKAVAVDPARRVAVAQPGLLLGELDRATQARGLATPLGVVSLTGIAGLTLGGGLGWLNGKHGLACDNLIAAHVVTADGRLLTASPDEHADLFWAIRGGSGNFGVVTSFTYRLHPVGPVLGGGVAFPPERAREALRFYHEFAAACPDELSTTAGLGVDAEGRPTVGVGVCWCGPLDAGERALRPLRAFGPPVADTIGPMSYTAVQTAGDAGFPPDRQHYWKASWLTDLSNGVIDVLLRFAVEKPSAATGIGLQQMHGAAARMDPAATAFPHRRDQYDLLILSQWSDPADAERNVAWTRALFDAVRPFAQGVYVNDLGEEGADRVREAYGANYARLAAIKAEYDPANLFRANQNVKPTA